jgi:hypothetical protein
MFFNDLNDSLEGLLPKLYYKTFKKVSQHDENFKQFLVATVEGGKARIEKALEALKEKNVKEAAEEYKNIRESLVDALAEVEGSNVDILLNLTSDGKLLAFHRFKMSNFYHSQTLDARGGHCGKLQTILVKPVSCHHSCTNCGCFFGKLEILMWVGGEKEANEWLPRNTIEVVKNKINFTVDKIFKCNLYVHQAKIQPGIGKSGLTDAKLVVAVNGKSDRTRVSWWNSKTQVDYPILFPGCLSIPFCCLE